VQYLQVPECGEGADHRERVKHFVYDYAYTTKCGPIPKLQNPKKSDINGNNAALGPHQTDTESLPSSGDSSASFDWGEPLCTPLYSTASSPFVLHSAPSKASSTSRPYSSLPAFPLE
ncbi:hypothetical protein FHG87_014730, partial [Trinorchestia longiramus]